MLTASLREKKKRGGISAVGEVTVGIWDFNEKTDPDFESIRRCASRSRPEERNPWPQALKECSEQSAGNSL